VRADDGAPEGLERGARRLGADHDSLSRSFQIAAADERGRALGRRDHIVQRETHGGELDRIDLDLSLAHGPAEDLRLRNARHGEDLRLHDPLHDIAQFHRR